MRITGVLNKVPYMKAPSGDSTAHPRRGKDAPLSGGSPWISLHRRRSFGLSRNLSSPTRSRLVGEERLRNEQETVCQGRSAENYWDILKTLAQFKRRTLLVPNLLLINQSNSLCSFTLGLAHASTTSISNTVAKIRTVIFHWRPEAKADK